MKIKSYIEFIKEDKIYIYNRKFRLDDLLKKDIYPESLIRKWMSEYDFDEFAHCMFICKKPIVNKIDQKNTFDLRISSQDIKNQNYFNSDIKKYNGYIPEDSKIEIKNDEIYLYIFKKNSNAKNRARQIHGFIYEGQLKYYNNLEKLSKTHKWDAKGGLDKRYLEVRLQEGKSIDFFNGKSYSSLISIDDINGFKDVKWSSSSNGVFVTDDFKNSLNWSIKCMEVNTDIELGDFKRISGLKKEGSSISILDSNEESFIFAVSIHDGSQDRNIIEEYITLMDMETWKELLPDIESNLIDFQDMYTELQSHRLKGERTKEGESAWLSFISKYKKLTQDSKIKLRFKRDSKGQLRIQSSISSLNFKKYVLKLPHIKIY